MRTESTKEARDIQANHERQITRVAAMARAFLKAYDEFFPEYPYAISEPLDHLLEATSACGCDEVGTIYLKVEPVDESYGVQVVNAKGGFKYWLSEMLTYEGACAVLSEAESFFESLGLAVVVEVEG